MLTGILRDSLGFQGLVVTDALNMAGVANAYGAGGGRCGPSSRAPTCCCSPPTRARRSTRWRAAVDRGEITPERLDRSVRRVLELKRRLGLFTRRTVPLDSIPAVVGNAGFQADARRDRRALDRAGEGLRRASCTGCARARPPLTLVTYGGGGQPHGGHRARGSSSGRGASR